MRFAALLVLGACGSWTPQYKGQFVAEHGGPPEIPVTDDAVTASGTHGISLAGGRHLGAVYAHEKHRVNAVRAAARLAAEAGGTHIVLRGAAVMQVVSSQLTQRETSTDPLAGKPRFSQPAVHRTQTTDDDVRAIFDVYRVEPGRWSELHELMRPFPRGAPAALR
jgi:hypothetical protein